VRLSRNFAVLRETLPSLEERDVQVSRKAAKVRKDANSIRISQRDPRVVDPGSDGASVGML